MATIHTLFSRPNESLRQRNESAKISYWLQKLFNQEEQKNKNRGQQIPQTETDETSTEESGRDEAVLEHFKKIGEDEHKLDDMMTKSNRVIVSISSMFPWDIFPSTINIEETRITIIKRQLFSSQVHSVDIKNISNVFIDTSLFFTTLTIVSSTFEENKIKIMKLRKKQAILVRRAIEGLRLFVEQDIDTSQYSIEELINRLKELSTTKTVF